MSGDDSLHREEKFLLAQELSFGRFGWRDMGFDIHLIFSQKESGLAASDLTVICNAEMSHLKSRFFRPHLPIQSGLRGSPLRTDLACVGKRAVNCTQYRQITYYSHGDSWAAGESLNFFVI